MEDTLQIEAKGIYPTYTKSRVKKAGQSVKKNRFSAEDLTVIENWRASHSHVINTFQANLRRRVKNKGFVVGQRLKRRRTILDKLIRQPSMSLPTMHDIAGCRVVFPDLNSLRDFRADFVENSRSKHIRLTAERDQFNYIKNPKLTGYRGIHDVYAYKSYAKSAVKWDGLLIEIQYRTRAQHAWATAVEIADLLTLSRGKFSEADTDYLTFFRVCSEIIARTQEDKNSCYASKTDRELVELYRSCTSNTDMLTILERTNLIKPQDISGLMKKGQNTILIYPYNASSAGFALRIQSVKNSRAAISLYETLEKDWDAKGDVVLVKSQDIKALRRVFQNYFSDSRDFVKYVKSGLKALN